MSIGLGLIIGGILVAFGSFLFALRNMYRIFAGSERKEIPLSHAFGRHIGSMAGMAVGGLLTLIGIVALVASKL